MDVFVEDDNARNVSWSSCTRGQNVRHRIGFFYILLGFPKHEVIYK